MDPDPDPLDALAATYLRWRWWRGQGDGTPLVYAWRLKSTPPVVLRDRSPAGLRARVDEFERVWRQTASLPEALAAAERLET